MKITQIPMGTHNAQLTCYLQDPCTEMPALDRCPAILIFPGGAYAFCSDREADPVALAFLNAGYNAFVLRYSVSQNCPVEEVYTNAFAEAQEAMDYLHQNAGDLHIDPEQIAVVGFSAGGHLAASVGTMGNSVNLSSGTSSPFNSRNSSMSVLSPCFTNKIRRAIGFLL